MSELSEQSAGLLENSLERFRPFLMQRAFGILRGLHIRHTKLDKVIHIESITSIRGNSSCRCMRLSEVAKIREIRKRIANCCGLYTPPGIALGKIIGTNRLGRFHITPNNSL
jgi:hypothetical protein